MKKYIKLILANLSIAAAAIVLYSPGLINLRLSDYSISGQECPSSQRCSSSLPSF